MASIIGTILGGVVVGAVLGPLVRLVTLRIRDISLTGAVVVGVVAAILGGFVAHLIGVGRTAGVDWIKLLIQIVFAVVGIGLFAGASNAEAGESNAGE